MELGYDQRPEWLKVPEVKGVFEGGCVSRGEGSRFRAKAHSHIKKKDPYYGWICYLSFKRLIHEELALHELAHILTSQGHTDKWRKKLLEIGGTLDPVPGLLRSYRKKLSTCIPDLKTGQRFKLQI